VLEEFRRQPAARPGRRQPQWECAGPFNIAGRVTALVVDPANHDVILAGAAAGGVWRSRDRGKTWETRWPKSFSQNIGALAMDPGGSRIIYCATGEANLSGDSYPGSGICVSRDGGDTWDLLAAAEACGLPRRIGTIRVNPFSAGRELYLGGVTHDETMPSGLYSSSDSGQTWRRENFFSSRNYWCHSIAFHPEGLVFVTLGLGGAQNGIWRLAAAGWERLERGLPPGDQLGRISLAIAPSQPGTIYAMAADWHGKRVLGVFRSLDQGENWAEIGGPHFRYERQMSYNNTIAADPEDPGFVVCGGVDLHITRDGGARWVRATQWNADEGAPCYVHGDHHAVVLPAPGLIFTGNDGGVAVSEDRGQTWSTRSAGMVTTMFYDIDVAPTNSKVFGGGTQDNGTLMTGIGGRRGEFQRVITGDGAWTVFDPTRETRVFTSRQNIDIVRHTASKHWESRFWVDATPAEMTEAEHRQKAIAVMAIHPVHGNIVWVGSSRLWRTTDVGRHWTPVSPFLDGSAITAIEVPSADPERILVGTTNGGIFRSLDRGKTWSGDLSGPEIPPRLISRIETHPRSAEKVVVTIAGTGVVSKLIPRAMRRRGGMSADVAERTWHVFYSDDGGSNWRHIDSADMPDVTCHAAAFETHAPYRLFVANDCGVWMTAGLKNWIDLSANLPNVIVSDLVYHHKDRIVTAATHGRGIWRLRLPATAS
jgi:photosystem II stability/assembly factor-like uncharacterized protein